MIRLVPSNNEHYVHDELREAKGPDDRARDQCWAYYDEAVEEIETRDVRIEKLKAENKRLKRKIGRLKADYDSLLGVAVDELLRPCECKGAK